MTNTQKREFIRGLMATMQETILANVDRMPDEWDGHELREYIADKVREMGCFGSFPPKRKRAYRNEVLVKNL